MRDKPGWSQCCRRVPPRARRNGFVAIALALSALFLLGMVGLAIDLGRMYVTKDEGQTFVDSAAIDAALQLNDKTDGVATALAKVAANRNRWQFGTSDFTTVTTMFGTTKDGPWLLSASLPDPPTGYYFARVVTSTTLPLSFLRTVVSASDSSIAAAAVAGRKPKTKFIEGLFPFSPYTHIGCTDPGCNANLTAGPGDQDPFGMVEGVHYTLRWPSTVTPKMENVCEGDRFDYLVNEANRDAPADDRGYIDFNSNSDIRQAIVYDSGTYSSVYQAGSSLPMAGGAGNTQGESVGARVASDGDSTSTTYAEYVAKKLGTGRRVVTVPVNLGPPNFLVAGFASFFLYQTAAEYAAVRGSDPICGEYIGTQVEGSPFAGGGPGGPPGTPLIFVIRLYQ